VRVGAAPQGQGHDTMWGALIEDRLGIPREEVVVVSADTSLVPQGNVTGGSRTMQALGSALHEAAGLLVERACELAAEVAGRRREEVVLDVAAGRFRVEGDEGAGMTWADLAEHAGPGSLSIEHRHRPNTPTFPFGTHVAVVEVDTETGKVDLVRFVAVDDAGRLLNPLLAEGQIHGGIAHGVAQALLEEVCYDAEGTLLTSTFADYGVITAAELPDFELETTETPSPLNPLGAKGVGESGAVGATPAVVNAVVDALDHLGVRHLDMPCTPERVWRAIHAATPAPTQ
jgi:aerobic carbon-monoxide dehydrogenase large subunit